MTLLQEVYSMVRKAKPLTEKKITDELRKEVYHADYVNKKKVHKKKIHKGKQKK